MFHCLQGSAVLGYYKDGLRLNLDYKVWKKSPVFDNIYLNDGHQIEVGLEKLEYILKNYVKFSMR